MVTYNKNLKKKTGRIVLPGRPRDPILTKPIDVDSQSYGIEELRKEIHSLRSQLDRSPLSQDDVTTKIDEALEEMAAELEEKYIEKISTLENLVSDRESYIEKLEGRLEKQDQLINNLTSNIGKIKISKPLENNALDEEPERPNIDSVFIDPTKKGEEDKLESHVKNTELKSSKPNTASSIKKLKSLMGGKI